jgi:hypothetical protein
VIGRTAALPPTPPKICRQPRTLERKERGKKALNLLRTDTFAQKSLVLLRLPARQAKVYLLKTPFFLLTLSSLLHPPFAVSTSSRHFHSFYNNTFGSFPPPSPSHRFPSDRIQWASASKGIRKIIHTYIQSDDCCSFASALVVGTHCPVHGQHSSRLPADLYTVSPRGHRGLIKESIS